MANTIKWDGKIAGGGVWSIPSSTDIVWGNNSYTWGDAVFVAEIRDGIGTGSRRAREARLRRFDKEKKKRLVHLICRVNGEKVYDGKKQSVVNYQIDIEDVDMVINEVLGIKVEAKNVL